MRKTTIVGSKKMAVFDDAEAKEKLRIYDNQAEVQDIRTYGDSIQVRFGDIWIPRVDMTEPLRLEAQHFIECVRDRKASLSVMRGTDFAWCASWKRPSVRSTRTEFRSRSREPRLGAGTQHGLPRSAHPGSGPAFRSTRTESG